ncbi:MAG: radical SAM protein, partial [Myxococcota bacterium]
FDVHVIAPVWRDNLADLVPLAEWLLALPSRIGGFFPWIPPLTVPGPHASRSAIAEQCAASFEQARRKKIRTGFADPLALPPCAAEGHLDRFGWVFQDRVRRQQQTSADFVRAPACGECSLASACPGIEPAFQRDVLVPVPLETSMGWQAKPRDFEEDDYRHISAFDNHDGPGRGLLRINGHCQMACSFCFVDRRVGDFPRESLEDAIASLASRQRDHLVLSGGEPTLHPELPALIATARDAGFKGVEIQSNGVRLADPEKVDQLVAAGLTKATISLHSVDPAESDAITKMKGAHPKTLEGIRQLRRAGVETQLAHVLTKRNYRALPEFVRTIGEIFPPAERKISLCLALAQGISDLVYSWVIPSFREVKPFVKEALDHCLDIGIGFGGLIGQGGYPPCMLDGDLRYYEGNLRHVYRSHDHRDQFHKAPRCQRCSFNPHCVGVRKDYVRCYGDDEITPFSERRRLPLV